MNIFEYDSKTKEIIETTQEGASVVIGYADSQYKADRQIDIIKERLLEEGN
jgi:hypothetical protein